MAAFIQAVDVDSLIEQVSRECALPESRFNFSARLCDAWEACAPNLRRSLQRGRAVEVAPMGSASPRRGWRDRAHSHAILQREAMKATDNKYSRWLTTHATGESGCGSLPDGQTPFRHARQPHATARDVPRPSVATEATPAATLPLPLTLPKSHPLFEWPASQANATIPLGESSKEHEVAHATLDGPSGVGESSFIVLPALVTPQEVEAILGLLRGPHGSRGGGAPEPGADGMVDGAVAFDLEPDSVDGESTHEFHLERHGSIDAPILAAGFEGKPDGDPTVRAARKPLRQQLASVVRPILRERITPFVQAHFSNGSGFGGTGCGELGSSRACTPCFSFVRRYRPNERHRHGVHFDMHALVTVVVSLSTHTRDYRGGLYVAAAGGRQRRTLALHAGDALVHQSDLMHGVQVDDDGGERWSWVLWYKDSTSCRDYSHEWNAAAAAEGNPLAQFLHAKRAHLKPFIEPADAVEESIRWLRASAEHGFGRAMNDLGMMYKVGHGSLPRDEAIAAQWFRRAIVTSTEADALFNLGKMVLEGKASPPDDLQVELDSGTPARAHARSEASAPLVAGGSAHDLTRGALTLFLAAAEGGSSEAMQHIGIALLRGVGGVGTPDDVAACQWLEAAGSAEAVYAAGSIHAKAGRPSNALRAWRRAANAGHAEARVKAAEMSAAMVVAKDAAANAELAESEGRKRSIAIDSDSSGGSPRVVVLDGLFSPGEIASLYKACHDPERAWRAEFDDIGRWGTPAPAGQASELDTTDAIVRLVKDRTWPHARALLERNQMAWADSYHLYRAYINRFNSSDQPLPHRDASFQAHVTTLLYPHVEWDERDGAATVFFDDAQPSKVRHTVLPKPGRVILFLGNELHAARPPLPHALQTVRLSIVLKYYASGLS